MADNVSVWFDKEGDFLEVILKRKKGYFRETDLDQVMIKVDDEGDVLGFSILALSSLSLKRVEIPTSGDTSVKLRDVATEPMRLEIALEPDEDGYHVWIPVLKGCHSFGQTRAEARENIIEAGQLWLEGAEELDFPIPEREIVEIPRP